MKPLLGVSDASIAVPRGPLLFSCGDLEVLPGRFVCLLGPNGAGKSTFLRTLTGLIQPRSGRVFLKDTPLENLPIDLRGHHLSAVFAASPLSPIVTVYDLVALGRHPYTGRRGKLSVRDRTIVEEELSRLELGPLRHRRVGQLSDGERRRAHLARGFAQRAPVLVLDEALAFLDAQWKRRVLSELKQRCRDGLAVVLATQDIAEALDTADTLWLIDRSKGTLLIGGPEDMALQGLVARAFLLDSQLCEGDDAPQFRYRVTGDEEPAAWTRRGLERAGGREADLAATFSAARGDGIGAEAGGSVPLVAVTVTRDRDAAAGGDYLWHYKVHRETQGRPSPPANKDTEVSGTVGTISELVEAVRALRRGR